MKIKSSKKRTRHILVRVTPYFPFGEEDEFMDFGFLYFEYTFNIEREIRLFHKKWRKAERRIQQFPIEIFEAILLKTSDIENCENSDNPDYRHIKYDSLNYLKRKPIFNDTDKYYGISATIFCYFDFFKIQVNRITDEGSGINIIYRAGANYTKLFDYKNGKIV